MILSGGGFTRPDDDPASYVSYADGMTDREYRWPDTRAREHAVTEPEEREARFEFSIIVDGDLDTDDRATQKAILDAVVRQIDRSGGRGLLPVIDVRGEVEQP